MIRIGIELNNIVRDLNRQVVKYYQKEIDRSFDDESVDMNVSNILDELKFTNKKQKDNFVHIDYPFEIFGCAKSMSRNLKNSINLWLDKVKENDCEIVLFSTKESELVIQSTYFYLSKGCRVRKVEFPTDGKDMWKECDVIVTIDKNIVESKPEDKTVVVIKKSDNERLVEMSDFYYNSLDEIIEDGDFFKKIKFSLGRNNKQKSLVNKIIGKIFKTK